MQKSQNSIFQRVISSLPSQFRFQLVAHRDARQSIPISFLINFSYMNATDETKWKISYIYMCVSVCVPSSVRRYWYWRQTVWVERRNCIIDLICDPSKRPLPMSICIYVRTLLYSFQKLFLPFSIFPISFWNIPIECMLEWRNDCVQISTKCKKKRTVYPTSIFWTIYFPFPSEQIGMQWIVAQNVIHQEQNECFIGFLLRDWQWMRLLNLIVINNAKCIKFRDWMQ